MGRGGDGMSRQAPMSLADSKTFVSKSKLRVHLNFGGQLISIAYEFDATSRFRTCTIVMEAVTTVLTPVPHVSHLWGGQPPGLC